MTKKYQWQSPTLKLWHNVLDGLSLLSLFGGVVYTFINGRSYTLVFATLSFVFILQLINGRIRKVDGIKKTGK